MIVFRYYQIDIINQVVHSIKNKHSRILVVCPTASGKTEIMAGLLNQLVVNSGPLTSLVVVPFSNLKKQTTNRMYNMGVATEVITYAGAMKLKPQYRDILLADECHHIASTTWRDIPDIIQSPILVGFTGTPYRADAEKLLEINGGIFDDLILGPNIEELAEQGFLANLEYYSYPIKKTITKQFFDFVGGSIETYTYKPENKENQIVEEYIKNFRDTPAIVFARGIGHAAEIAQKFNNAGIISRDINCYQPAKLKEEIVSAVQNEHVKVLVGCNMMSEGLDAPHLKLAIMARPIVNSLTMFLQQIGRVIRPHDNETAKVLDLVGNWYRFPTLDKIKNVPIM